MRAHQRLAAAGGDADGDIRHIVQPRQLRTVLVAQRAVFRRQHGFGVRVRVRGKRFGNAFFLC
ncbi:MAG: hypothetical protein FWC58_03815, partial [Desulfobulbus sp.]|nr:hypothetical protein [Desulfobulbus sp.]